MSHTVAGVCALLLAVSACTSESRPTSEPTGSATSAGAGGDPSTEGTYLAACVFYHALTGAPVPSSAALPAGIDTTEAAALQAAAEAAVGE